jgi:putative FmdB family regulatory protein
MPRYDYKCKSCSSGFFVIRGINDPRDNIACPDCGSTDTARIFNAVVLKGERARGYQAEDEVKEEEETPPSDKAEHDHCSPDEDYQ